MIVCGFCVQAEAQKEAPPEAGQSDSADAGANGENEGKVSAGAAFMTEMSRLSSILGSVHFLRTLCGDENAGVWRQKMNDLIEAQAPNAADKEILIASFNGGYRAFESTYRKCTPAARLAVRRYQDEGVVLSREINARYGN